MLFVMIVGIVLLFFVRVESPLMRVIVRIALLPVIAGISYELIKWAGSSENPIVCILSKPGLWLQGLTTKEPDDEMIEVGIASVEAVFDWKAYLRENFPDTEIPEDSTEMAASGPVQDCTAAAEASAPAQAIGREETR
mgnify:CR=1 FL=1